MHVVRAGDAPGYEAAGHSGMRMRRLQGRQAGPSDTVWIGLSVIEPGGGAAWSASDVEKFYVVLEGTLELACEYEGNVVAKVLQQHDSCRVAPGESRRLRNAGEVPATTLLIMPNSS